MPPCVCVERMDVASSSTLSCANVTSFVSLQKSRKRSSYTRHTHALATTAIQTIALLGRLKWIDGYDVVRRCHCCFNIQRFPPAPPPPTAATTTTPTPKSKFSIVHTVKGDAFSGGASACSRTQGCSDHPNIVVVYPPLNVRGTNIDRLLSCGNRYNNIVSGVGRHRVYFTFFCNNILRLCVCVLCCILRVHWSFPQGDLYFLIEKFNVCPKKSKMGRNREVSLSSTVNRIGFNENGHIPQWHSRCPRLPMQQCVIRC